MRRSGCGLKATGFLSDMSFTFLPIIHNNIFKYIIGQLFFSGLMFGFRQGFWICTDVQRTLSLSKTNCSYRCVQKRMILCCGLAHFLLFISQKMGIFENQKRPTLLLCHLAKL